MEISNAYIEGCIKCFHHGQLSKVSVLDVVSPFNFLLSAYCSISLYRIFPPQSQGLFNMSVAKPKSSFPREKPYKQYIDRVMFLCIGLLLHALPQGARYISEKGFFELFTGHKHVSELPGTLARYSSERGYGDFADSIINTSRLILFPSNSSKSRKDIYSVSCPLFSQTLGASAIGVALASWWTSVVLLIREVSPDSHLTAFFAIMPSIISFKILAHIISGFRLKRFDELNACIPVKIMPNPFPWKFRRYFELSKMNADLLDEYLFKKYSENGLTHGLGTVLTKRVKTISTIEAANFKAVLSTNFDDWERPAFRAGAARPFKGCNSDTCESPSYTALPLTYICRLVLIGGSLPANLVTKDGPHWAYSRKTMKSQFTRSRIDDNLLASERHLQDLFHALGRVDYNGWTETKDFMVITVLLLNRNGFIIISQDYFFRFAMDSSTEFLIGLSANTQICAMVQEGKIEAKPHIVDMDGVE